MILCLYYRSSSTSEIDYLLVISTPRSPNATYVTRKKNIRRTKGPRCPPLPNDTGIVERNTVRILCKMTPPSRRVSKPISSTTGRVHPPSDAPIERPRQELSKATIFSMVGALLIWRDSPRDFISRVVYYDTGSVVANYLARKLKT